MEVIKDNHVVQSPLFNMLEGARALEVSNKRLDTGLIALSEDELKFDTYKPQKASSVIGVMNQLVILYMSWLNNSSLPVTVLSCRYVQTFLENYLKHGGDLKKTTFRNERLYGSVPNDDESFEHKLTNMVLRSFVMGLCKIIGFTLTVGMNVLYEEEDLTTRSMDFDYLISIPYETIMYEINNSILWINSQTGKDEKELELIVQYLRLLQGILSLLSLFVIPINIFNEERPQLIEHDCKFIKESLQLIQTIKSTIESSKYEAPAGVFSMFVQLDCNNPSIPNEIYCLPADEAYTNLTNCFERLLEFIRKLSHIDNFNQLINFLKFDVSQEIDENYSVLARGLFQLFFIRDDRSIVGSSTENITSLTMKYMENFCCLNSNIIRPDYWNSIGGNEDQIATTKTNIMDQLNKLLGDVEAGIHHLILIPGNNRCRQRQLLSRAILIWDTLQASLENLEVELWNNHQIGDKLYNFNEYTKDYEEDEQDLSLSITSFIYYMKLEVMMEVALSGFELDLYKDFEFGQMYWYLWYLSQLMTEHLSTRVDKIQSLKIHYIKNVIPKRLKKLKAGSKKQNLKNYQQYCNTQVLPILEIQSQYNKEYLIPINQAMNLLCDSIRYSFIIYDALKLIQIGNVKTSKFVNQKLLFNLRMKPWSSVGVPTLPTYEQYLNSISTEFLNKYNSESLKLNQIKDILKVIVNKVNQAKEIYNQILKLIESNPLIKSQIISESNSKLNQVNITKWYQSLAKTCVFQSIQLTNLIKTLQEPNFNANDYRIHIQPGYHKYFPQISVIKKT